MFRFLLKVFYNEKFTYLSSFSKDDIVSMLNTLFNERSGIFKSPNLTGKFVDYPDSFNIEPKWSVAVINSFERRPAYLKGTISSTEHGGTIIEVSVRPNSIFGIFFLIFVPIGIYNACLFFTKNGSQNDLIAGLFILLLAVPILLGIARATSVSLRENFEGYMNIHAVNSI